MTPSVNTLDPRIWGPHYWFVLHTIALTYPERPNDVIKKKYYDFIQNLPLFLPVPSISNYFVTFLDKYPVTPYLDSRSSFIKWMHFIHNQINLAVGTKQISLEESLRLYDEQYTPPAVVNQEQRTRREKYAFIGIVVCLVLAVILLYRQQ